MRWIAISMILLSISACVGTRPERPHAQVERQTDVDEASPVREAFLGFFQDCASGDYDAACKALAPMKGKVEVAEDYVASRLTRYGSLGAMDPTRIHAVHTLGDKAVLAYWEGKTDLDPFYFIRRDGRWRILLSLTSYYQPYYSFTDEDVSHFNKLRKWFEQLKNKELYGNR